MKTKYCRRIDLNRIDRLINWDDVDNGFEHYGNDEPACIHFCNYLGGTESMLFVQRRGEPSCLPSMLNQFFNECEHDLSTAPKVSPSSSLSFYLPGHMAGIFTSWCAKKNLKNNDNVFDVHYGDFLFPVPVSQEQSGEIMFRYKLIFCGDRDKWDEKYNNLYRNNNGKNKSEWVPIEYSRPILLAANVNAVE